MIEERPWGTYEVLLEANNCKVKRIIVKPKGRLSYQSHEHRSETWTCVQGMGLVTINDNDQVISPKRTVYIEQGQKHRISNISPIYRDVNNNETQADLIFIEVQHSNEGIFDETDITRYEDDYNRE